MGGSGRGFVTFRPGDTWEPLEPVPASGAASRAETYSFLGFYEPRELQLRPLGTSPTTRLQWLGNPGTDENPMGHAEDGTPKSMLASQNGKGGRGQCL